jgi:hypothetical protein
VSVTTGQHLIHTATVFAVIGAAVVLALTGHIAGTVAIGVIVLAGGLGGAPAISGLLGSKG